jgi:signal transduction histidine kinase
MSVRSQRQQATGSWIFLGMLAAVALILGGLQYRWIGEISRAERERMKSSLQTSLNRVSRDFNAELSAACSRVTPASEGRVPSGDEYAVQYLRWRSATQRSGMFRTIAIAQPDGSLLELHILDQNGGVFVASDWPERWRPLQERLQARLSNEGPGRFGSGDRDTGSVIDIPFFRPPGDHGPFGRRESQWLLLEIDSSYLTSTLVPELLRRDLGDLAMQEYDFEVFARSDPRTTIYASARDREFPLEAADVSVGFFDVHPEMRPQHGGPPRFDRGPMPPGPPPRGAGPGRPRPPEALGFAGRWILAARHRAGSLESAVARTRTRNLAVSSAMLFLILAAGVALVRFTRGAQKLAELQMEFVAGVSHELRTPLSVMRTAGHNLQTHVGNDPAKVHKYGALIEHESEKLTAVVEQILQFSNAKAGRIIGPRVPVSVASIIDDALAADRQVIEDSGCVVQRDIEPELEPVLGDRATLTHAVKNLITNAAKYGNKGDWIGISASMRNNGRSLVEIRIADRGEGVAPDELQQIFEPFYRGRKAVAEQIHGTGLGLSLVKRIVEAHEGTIVVESASPQGTAFVIRLPTAPAQLTHEFENSTR